ncbi:NAD(P)/FAD-dependent oxidoreductase [Microbulbifer sp. HZ11]|uniref:flavin-containing monooxygenase n=1 Tax=Microbulbifer sp. HZ11 TaxID=1453501 RepID=UPI0005B9F2CA|nr:NAD(P)/FAD-dependent oxidoreductase [Microbulbifer sp. HZ11]
MRAQYYDTLIVGAGLSGIGTACHLKQHCPDRKFAILERRDRLGGTWDLFRYPGIRSDSDMFTFGFSFRPWNGDQVLADGSSIRQYLGETAQAFQVNDHIHYGINLTSASWCSSEQCWTLSGICHGKPVTYNCRVLISCAGYYDYAQGHAPEFSGVDRYQGEVIHPQHWPEDLEYAGKKILVIGSGATAVTLVPALAKKAAHVTMLQRSPTYILSMPGRDRLLSLLKRFFPERAVFAFARWRNLRLHRLMFKAAKRWPETVRRLILRGVRKALNGHADMRHFTPEYQPWDQRLCAVPDGDLFEAIKAGRATVVTDTVDTFTTSGIQLKSGKVLDADIVVSATGLRLQLLGGMALTVDGEHVDMRNRLTYKGVLMEGVPNMAWVFGYTNAAWTLKSDISAGYICRLLNHLQERKLGVFIPIDREGCKAEESVMAALQSGYVERADGILPRQGTRYPWRLLNDYERDRKILLKGELEDEFLNFYPPLRAGDRKLEATVTNPV